MKKNWPGLILTVIVALLPFMLEKQVHGAWITLTDILIAGAVLGWSYQSLRGKDQRRFPQLPLVGGLLALVLLSGISSLFPWLYIKEALKYLLIFGFFYFCIDSIDDAALLRRLFRIVAITGTMMAVWFISDFVSGHVSSVNRSCDRYVFGFELSKQHLNALGVYFALAIPFCFYEMINAVSKRYRSIWGALSIVQIIALYLTFSRANWIALGTALLFFFLIKYRARGVAYVVVFMVIPFWALSLAFPGLALKERLFSITDLTETSALSRAVFLKTSLKMIQLRPLTGTGVGNYNEAVKNDLGLDVDEMVHNAFLQIAVEAGIPAMILLLGIIGKYYYDSINTYRSLSGDPVTGTFILFTLLSFTSLMISVQFGDIFTRGTKEYFALLLAMPYAIKNLKNVAKTTI